MDLSVIIITRDEEADLPACLESVSSLGAEVVVLDNHSTDRTVEIARSFGAKVAQREFDGYAPQKQAALELASRGWVLSIDADERVTPELAAELSQALTRPGGPAGFEIPFAVVYQGRTLRWGGLGRERHLRLFRRAAGRFIGGKIHEGVEIQGEIGRLEGRIRHIPYRDLSEHLRKLDRYTTLMARKHREAGRRASPLHAILPAWEFFSRFILRLGFLDGSAGFSYALMASFYTWVKYAKLSELERAGDA